jgi:hypothetical protein
MPFVYVTQETDEMIDALAELGHMLPQEIVLAAINLLALTGGYLPRSQRPTPSEPGQPPRKSSA